jgi:hypothetical protein
VEILLLLADVVVRFLHRPHIEEDFHTNAKISLLNALTGRQSGSAVQYQVERLARSLLFH